MSVHNVYFDDRQYQEGISLHDVSLMLGRVHSLTLRTNPETVLDDIVVSAPGLSVSAEGNTIVVDLSKETKERDVKVTLSSDRAEFQEWFVFHLFPSITKRDLFGSYRSQEDGAKTLSLSEKGATLDLADLVDGLSPFRADSFDFDPLSCRLLLTFRPQEVDGVLFTAHPDFLYSPRERRIVGACALEAYSEEGREECFLLGEGDEDGVTQRSAFLRIED